MHCMSLYLIEYICITRHVTVTSLFSRILLRHVSAYFYTKKTVFLFPFTLNGIWSWWLFTFRFKPNGIPFGSKSKVKLSLQSYPIQCERKYTFLSAHMLSIFTHVKLMFDLSRCSDWWKLETYRPVYWLN